MQSFHSTASNREQIRRLLILVPIIGALAIPATAAAVEPTRETVLVKSTALAPCPSGLALVGEFDVVREITTFYDQDGQPVRQLWVASFEGTWTNPLTGATLPSSGIRVFDRDLVSGELFTTGTNIVTKLGDGGVAIGGAGLQIFDAHGRLVEHRGPDTATEREQLCAALGA
jgi:hypothetical protein